MSKKLFSIEQLDGWRNGVDDPLNQDGCLLVPMRRVLQFSANRKSEYGECTITVAGCEQEFLFPKVDAAFILDGGIKKMREQIEGLEFVNKKLNRALEIAEDRINSAYLSSDWTQEAGRAVKASGQGLVDFYSLPEDDLQLCGTAKHPRWKIESKEFLRRTWHVKKLLETPMPGMISAYSLKPLMNHAASLQRFHDDHKGDPVEKKKPRLRDRAKALAHRSAWAGIGAAASAAVGLMF